MVPKPLSQSRSSVVFLTIFLLLVLITVLSSRNSHVQIKLSSVSVAKWPPFGKEQLTRLIVCSLFSILVISRFGFEDRVLVLMVSVPCYYFLLLY